MTFETTIDLNDTLLVLNSRYPQSRLEGPRLVVPNFLLPRDSSNIIPFNYERITLLLAFPPSSFTKGLFPLVFVPDGLKVLGGWRYRTIERLVPIDISDRSPDDSPSGQSYEKDPYELFLRGMGGEWAQLTMDVTEKVPRNERFFLHCVQRVEEEFEEIAERRGR